MKLIRAFLKFLGGERGEEKKMILLLGKGFFMGIMLASYKVGAETLFVSYVGTDLLDVAFFSTGFLGIVFAIGYVWLQRKVNFSSLLITLTFFIMLAIIAMRWSFHLNDYQINDTYKWIIFVMFVLGGPITSITLLGFWGAFGRIFDVRQTKRIIGGIDTGQLFATLIAFYSIPALSRLKIIDQSWDLVSMSSVGAIGVFIFTFLLVINFNMDRETKILKDRELRKQVGIKNIWGNRYLRLLSLFLVVSMAASVFASYTFLSASGVFYPVEGELRNFFAFFSGTVIVVSFLIQSFVNDFIIGRFGLRVALITMPLLLIGFTIGAIVSGHAFGYQVKTETFLLYFLFTASAKLFTDSLKDALENPAFKLFFLPIDIKIRFDIQSRIEGVVNEFAKLSSGALQIAFGFLAFFELIHFGYFILVLAAMVVYLAYKLYDQYKITLKETLEKQKEVMEDRGKRNENSVINFLVRQTKSRDGNEVLIALKVLEKLDPFEFDKALVRLLASRHAYIRKYAYEKLEEKMSFDLITQMQKEIKTEGDEETLAIGQRAIENLQKVSQLKPDEAQMRALIRSTEAKDRILAARLLMTASDDKEVAYLVELLRDINPAVRNAALKSAGKVKRPELWNILIENLHLTTYSNVAISGLKQAGVVIFNTVDSAFYRTGQYLSTMIRIVQLFGQIGGRQAVELLWKKIDFPDKRIVSEMLLSLSYQGFEAKEYQVARIKVMVEKEIGDVAWNIKVLEEIPKHTNLDAMIRQALVEEDEVNHANIFMLLAMLYDAQNVTLVKDNLDIGTSESISFGVEMLDVFVGDELKPKLFPILDEIKVEDKLARLQNYYPPESFDDYLDLLIQIVNRDYNRINRYTKALALFRISELSRKVTNDLIAVLFNSDPLLRQTAGYAIYKIDRSAYHFHTNRLDPFVKKELDRAIVPPVFRGEDEDFHQKLLLVERVILLKKLNIFNDIPGLQITYMAERLDEILVRAGTKVIESGEPGSIPVYIILEGQVKITYDDGEEQVLEKGSFFGERLILESDQFSYTAESIGDVKLLVLRKEELLDLMSIHIDITEAVLQMIKKGVVAIQEETTMDLFI